LIRCYARLLPGHRIAQELGPVDAIREGAATCTVRARGGTLFVDSPEVLRPELQRRLAAVLDAGLWSASGPQFCAVVSLLQEGDGAMPALEPELRAVLDRFVPATVPPLRSYPQDVPRLCEVILDDAGPTASGVPRRLTEAAERALTAYHWPGNIRQLCRVVEAAAARAGDQPIAVDHLPAEVREPTASAIPVPTLREVEREHILRVLALCGDNKTKAARKLDISPSTLHEKLKRYEFDS
jgi:two-component system response regulator HydG